MDSIQIECAKCGINGENHKVRRVIARDLSFVDFEIKKQDVPGDYDIILCIPCFADIAKNCHEENESRKSKGLEPKQYMFYMKKSIDPQYW